MFKKLILSASFLPFIALANQSMPLQNDTRCLCWMDSKGIPVCSKTGMAQTIYYGTASMSPPNKYNGTLGSLTFGSLVNVSVPEGDGVAVKVLPDSSSYGGAETLSSAHSTKLYAIWFKGDDGKYLTLAGDFIMTPDCHSKF